MSLVEKKTESHGTWRARYLGYFSFRVYLCLCKVLDP